MHVRKKKSGIERKLSQFYCLLQVEISVILGECVAEAINSQHQYDAVYIIIT